MTLQQFLRATIIFVGANTKTVFFFLSFYYYYFFFNPYNITFSTVYNHMSRGTYDLSMWTFNFLCLKPNGYPLKAPACCGCYMQMQPQSIHTFKYLVLQNKDMNVIEFKNIFMTPNDSLEVSLNN